MSGIMGGDFGEHHSTSCKVMGFASSSTHPTGYIERELAKGTRLARDQERDANPEVAIARLDWAAR
jgi:hypothetical protein